MAQVMIIMLLGKGLQNCSSIPQFPPVFWPRYSMFAADVGVMSKGERNIPST